MEFRFSILSEQTLRIQSKRSQSSLIARKPNRKEKAVFVTHIVTNFDIIVTPPVTGKNTDERRLG